MSPGPNPSGPIYKEPTRWGIYRREFLSAWRSVLDALLHPFLHAVLSIFLVGFLILFGLVWVAVKIFPVPR